MTEPRFGQVYRWADMDSDGNVLPERSPLYRTMYLHDDSNGAATFFVLTGDPEARTFPSSGLYHPDERPSHGHWELVDD